MRTEVTEILEALDVGRVLWAGSMAPRHDMSMAGRIYDPGTDFRLPAEFHQAFDLTYLVERDLGQIKQWPLVVDEALRSLKPGGIFVVRLRETAFLSIFQLANFIEKWTGGAYQTIDQVAEDGHYLLTLRLTHAEPRLRPPASVCFALVTDGRKPASVQAFVESVLAMEGRADARTEILICGPPQVLEALGPLANAVRLVDQPTSFATQGWITRKKNLLVDSARCDTIVVAHDRYVVPADFLRRLEAFGYDFDVLAPRQQTADGMALPDWVAAGDHLAWGVPGWMDHGDYHPFIYVNGGVLIARTELLQRVRWSELLFWGQAEDVDLSRRLSDQGVTPRLAREIVFVSEHPRLGFVDSFQRIPWRDDAYPQTDRPHSHLPAGVLGPLAIEPKYVSALRMEDDIDLSGPLAVSGALRRGLVLHRPWSSTKAGVVWSLPEDASFSLKLSGRQANPTLSMVFASPEEVVSIHRVLINGVASRLDHWGGVRLEASVPPSVLREGGGLHVQIARSVGAPLTLCWFCMTNAPLFGDHDLADVRLTSGSPHTGWLIDRWREPEDWGTWTAGKVADLVLPLAVAPKRRLKGAVGLIADFPAGAGEQVVVLLADGTVVGRWTLTRERPRITARFTLPKTLGERVRLTFRSSRLTLADGNGCGAGGWRGVGVTGLSVVEAGR